MLASSYTGCLTCPDVSAASSDKRSDNMPTVNGQVIGTPALRLGCSGFEPRSRDRLLDSNFAVISSVSPFKCSDK